MKIKTLAWINMHPVKNIFIGTLSNEFDYSDIEVLDSAENDIKLRIKKLLHIFSKHHELKNNKAESRIIKIIQN